MDLTRCKSIMRKPTLMALPGADRVGRAEDAGAQVPKGDEGLSAGRAPSRHATPHAAAHVVNFKDCEANAANDGRPRN